MSFVTSQLFLSMNAIRRSDAQYNTFKANDDRMNLASKRCTGPNCMEQMHNTDKQLTFTSLKNAFVAKCSDEWEASLEQQKKKDIEKSFNTFA